MFNIMLKTEDLPDSVQQGFDMVKIKEFLKYLNFYISFFLGL